MLTPEQLCRARALITLYVAAEAANQLWVSDITYISTVAGFIYLAVVLDAWSRWIVGWAFSTDTRDVTRFDDRRMINGFVQVLKSGCRWKAADPAYGPRKALYNRYAEK